MKENGVEFIQGFVFQNMPQLNIDGYLKRYHYMGERNVNKQRYLVRNCYFEPSTDQHFDWVSNCLKQIRYAFWFNKPAIISMHRINFVGGIEESNRLESMKKLNNLLVRLLQLWPDVEFMSSDRLGAILSK
jgi:hypothetical protein